MSTIDYIFNNFKITNEEYAELDREFGNLCYYAAQNLKRNNSRNNLTDEVEDIAQETRLAVMSGGVYTKRQKYIESSIRAVMEHVNDPLIIYTLNVLDDAWKNKTRHGANRQRFGAWQEEILEKLLVSYVPVKHRPNKNRKLEIDAEFRGYCNAILWNKTRNLGKKITRDRKIRSGQVSLSEFSFMGVES